MKATARPRAGSRRIPKSKQNKQGDGSHRQVVKIGNLPTSYPVTDNGGSLTVDGSVSVSSSALPSGAATAANQTNGDQKAQIVQTVTADNNNSSTTNLAAGNSYTFTGTATDTLGVAGFQVSLFADKNCHVYIDQSPNGTNWDIVDDYIL